MGRKMVRCLMAGRLLVGCGWLTSLLRNNRVQAMCHVAALWLLSRHLDPPWLSPQGRENSSGYEVGHLEKLRSFIQGLVLYEVQLALGTQKLIVIGREATD